MNWQSLLSLRISDDWKLIAELGIVPMAAILVGLALFIYWIRPWEWRRDNPEFVELNIRLGDIGKVKIRPNHEAVQVAHRAWVELATRKAGIVFDPKNDVIVEVYDSWYQLFSEMRELAKQVPAHRIRKDESTRRTVDLIVDALNKGLRPHLTQWQARFRAWYADARERNKGSNKDPQDLQREYPEYDALVADLQGVNRDLMQYMSQLRKLVEKAPSPGKPGTSPTLPEEPIQPQLA